MANSNENFEEFSLLHRTSIRIPKDRLKIKEINYEDEDDFFVINIDYHDLFEIIKTGQSLSFSQILGRALARTRINEPLKSIWTFISKEDLEKTDNKNADDALFFQIIRNIKNLIPSPPIAIILWQKKDAVFGAMLKDDEIKTSGPFKNFTEAEIIIQKALKEFINHVS